ncbi:MAG: AAA family ATPase [Lachnospiraceae bacterium]|nr:AAA family ATPase [Lachnospiraceae bacterium]
MQYITCTRAAELLGMTPRRIQQMCKSGEISGAIKRGRTWMVPADVCLAEDRKGIATTKKQLPIGISDFKEATTGYYYVDKTLLIRDFLNQKPMVSLFTRPRRFGKTLNMDMLRVFFEKTSEDTSIYFKDKLIWKCGSEYTDYQGKYPVIFLTFKDVKCNSWAETMEKLCRLIALEFQRHVELEISDALNVYEKEQYIRLANGTANQMEYQMSLQLLSLLLHKHYSQKAIIIIDEYDTPIEQGHTCGFYAETINFMRNFFSGGLKDNSHLAYGFLTGILRVAKESIFSGLNNLKINSVLDEAYSRYFGFTKEEIAELLHYYNADDKYAEICDWYDGYLFGNTEIFNPWSVINYIADNGFPKAYWQSTGSNEIIGEIISLATPEITESLHKLLLGQSITTYIDTSVIYPEVQNNPYSIYSFLLVAGYLKVAHIYPQHDGNFMCEVAIPNKEISYVYEKEILAKNQQSGLAISVRQAIFSKDAMKLQTLLEEFMLHSISSFDGVNEGFYHGMMLGLCAVLSNQYRIRSNRESGYGRYDIQLIPQNKENPGFLFELKYAKNSTEDLTALAETALEQIEVKKYDAELRSLGVTEIVKTGIAFHGKRAEVKRRS